MIAKFLKITAALVAIGVVVMAGLVIFAATADIRLPIIQPKTTQQGPVKFMISDGQTGQQVADALKQQGLIDSPELFRLFARLENKEDKYYTGTFDLKYGMTMFEIINALASPPPEQEINITIREGLRTEEIADELEKAGVTTAVDFMRVLTDTSLKYDFLDSKPPDANVSGFLFPDTYRIPSHYKAIDVARMMLDDFGARLTPDLRQAAADKGTSIYDAVILGSIIEREAQVPNERAIISSVYHNRINASMMLQADPTVQYAIGKPGNWWAPQLTLDDLQVDSPYNTYKSQGLPPGPICNPGIASIRAALVPADTTYMYFVATGDGSHAFATTLDEHNQNVAKYQK